MKVHLIKEQTIWDYCAKHRTATLPFTDWLNVLKSADWNIPDDIEATFGSADLLGKGSQRAVFNIGGNNFRRICRYKFTKNMAHLSIRWIGTHPEYDKLCGVSKNKKKGKQDSDQYNINLY